MSNTARKVVGGIISLIGVVGAIFGIMMMSVNSLGVVLGVPLILVCLIVVGVGVLVMR